MAPYRTGLAMMTDPYPVTPYAGTSGYSGSETSYDRAVRRDADGSTATLQSWVVVLVGRRGAYGLTVAEARVLLPMQHHGSISGALSNLHQSGSLACLTERRDGCHPYVLPVHVEGRETREHGRR